MNSGSEFDISFINFINAIRVGSSTVLMFGASNKDIDTMLIKCCYRKKNFSSQMKNTLNSHTCFLLTVFSCHTSFFAVDFLLKTRKLVHKINVLLSSSVPCFLSPCFVRLNVFFSL